MRRRILLFLVLCGGCGVDPSGELVRLGGSGGGGPTVSFALDIQPLFVRECIRCHGGAGSLNLDTYAGVMQGGLSGVAVVPGDPAGSLILDRLDGTQPPTMPADGPALPAAEIHRIRQWILEGALNN